MLSCTTIYVTGLLSSPRIPVTDIAGCPLPHIRSSPARWSVYRSVLFQCLHQYQLGVRVHLHLPEYAELGQYDAGREPLCLQVLGQRFAEEDEEVLLHGVFHAVPFVVLVQLFYLLALVPVSESAFQQGERLGVDTGMVHRGVVVYAGDGDGEETPVSADVLQALPVVGARDEGAVRGRVKASMS